MKEEIETETEVEDSGPTIGAKKNIREKPSRRFFLVCLVFISLILLSVLAVKFLKPQQDIRDQLLLEFTDNKFKLSFNLTEPERSDFNSFLKELNLKEPNTNDAMFFELDATSSAKLEFLPPIKSNLDASTKKLSLEGTIAQRYFGSKIETNPLEIPGNFEFAIYSHDLFDLAFQQLNLNRDQINKIKEEVKPKNGHFFITADSAENFALYFQSDADIGSIQSFQSIAAETESKLYAINLSESTQNNTQQLTIFENENYKIIASSVDFAHKILEDNKKTTFPQNLSNIDAKVLFQPRDEFDSQKFTNFITNNGLHNQVAKNNVVNALSKIKTLEFSLKGTDFSVLINLK